MRIVSLLPSATEILFAIGAGDAVVGVTHECDFPPQARSRAVLTSSLLPSDAADAAGIDRHVRASVHAGSSLYALDAERLAQLEPDLIVTQELCAVCAVSYEIVEQAAKRSRSDPRVVSLEPSSLADVYGTIGFLGELAGYARGAGAVVDGLRAREAVLRHTPYESTPTALILEWSDPPMSGGHWTPGLVELAGATPLLAHPGANSQTLAWDAIAEADPDVIVVVPCGFDLAHARRAVDDLADNSTWNALRATKYVMDGNAYVNRPGPRLIDSADRFAWAFHETPLPAPSGISSI
ncbi:MAG TPA: cobalamin-binding protein [Candidatus Lustribacter sp.]|nr:cobalamin-binding protein [Candidatus Lustribacter sp.]